MVNQPSRMDLLASRLAWAAPWMLLCYIAGLYSAKSASWNDPDPGVLRGGNLLQLKQSIDIADREEMHHRVPLEVPATCNAKTMRIPVGAGWGREKVAGHQRETCGKCYEDMLKELASREGVDAVFGANDGISWDPAWYYGYWGLAAKHKKVYVEPIPFIYKRLVKNLEASEITSTTALNIAVHPDFSPGTLGYGFAQKNKSPTATGVLELWCWNEQIINVSLGLNSSSLPSGWPTEVRKPQAHWAAECALDQYEVTQAANVFSTTEFLKLNDNDQERVKLQVNGMLQKHTLPARTVSNILKASASFDRPVRYVQIDVEGLDNDIVTSLPFDSEYLKPNMILFENHNGKQVTPILEKQGYFVCCCLNRYGNNMVAVKNSTW